MNVLVIFAHPKPTSFTCALKAVARGVLMNAGPAVEVSDLYGEIFNPVAGRHDLTSVHEASSFHYQSEQGHAHATGWLRSRSRARTAACPKGRPNHLALSDLVGRGAGHPQGWFDRVMGFGFAYADGRRYDSGFFKDKTGMLRLTTGGTVERFSAGNVCGRIGRALYPTQYLILDYLGMKSYPPFATYAAPRINAAGREAYLRQWRARVLEIAADMPPRSSAA